MELVFSTVGGTTLQLQGVGQDYFIVAVNWGAIGSAVEVILVMRRRRLSV